MAKGKGQEAQHQTPPAKKRARVKSSPMLFFVLLLLILALGYQLVQLRGKVGEAEAEKQRLSTEVEACRQENAALESDIAQGSTPEKMKELARDELGWVGPGEYVFYDVSN